VWRNSERKQRTMTLIENEYFYVKLFDPDAEDTAIRLARKYKHNAVLETKTLTILVNGAREWQFRFCAELGRREVVSPAAQPAELPPPEKCTVCGVDTLTFGLPLCDKCEQRSRIWLARKAREEL